MSVNQQAAAFGAGTYATLRGIMTQEEVNEVVALRSLPRPMPWQALQARFGRAVETLKAVVAQGVPPEYPAVTSGDFSTTRDARLAAMWEDGQPVGIICERLGLSPAQVHLDSVRLHLTPRITGRPCRVWRPSEDALLREHYGKATAHKIAGMIGCSRCAVLGRAARLGLSKSKAVAA